MICTGDISEGARESALAEVEYTAALDAFERAGLPLLDALGTHEPRAVHQRIGLPRFSAWLGGPIHTPWFSFDTPGARFILLDYLDLAPGNPQALWFGERLLSAPPHRPVFVFGHGPFADFARPFFSHPPMQRVFERLFTERTPTVYFCGHTHNQAVTLHQRRGGRFAQVKCSSVGSPYLPFEPLERRRVLLLEDGAEFLWGCLEDQHPGYWICDLEDSGELQARWYGVERGLAAEILVPPSAGTLQILRRPRFDETAALTPGDLPLIKNAMLELAMAGDARGDFECRLNGIPLGCLPPNTGLAARRALPLTAEAVAALGRHNTLELRPGRARAWLAEAARIVAHTLDGRRLCSRIPNTIFAAGAFAERTRGQQRATPVPPDRALPIPIRLE